MDDYGVTYAMDDMWGATGDDGLGYVDPSVTGTDDAYSGETFFTDEDIARYIMDQPTGFDPSGSINYGGIVVNPDGSVSSSGGLGFGDVLKGFQNLMSGKSSLGTAGSLLAMGGIGKLLNNMMGGGGGGGGYQGSIPKLTATRTMLPIPQTVTTPTGEVVTRRPGSGGVTYFSPMVYSPAAEPASSTAASGSTTTTPDEGGARGAAAGGIMGIAQRYNLGGYSDGGRLLKGPGDGVSDDIPATIGDRQPARLADGEFVIPARIVSELGNGSTEAGARKLYEMMDRVKQARMKSRKNIAVDSKADKHLPA
jgi:hypothetical protein